MTGDGPIYMLYALWFRPNGGAERYRDYIRAATPLVEAAGGEALDVYRPVQAYDGDFQPDLIFFVRYPSLAAYDEMVASPGFQAIAHLRDEAVERSVLTRCETSH